jgi:signal transduction histidine kinase
MSETLFATTLRSEDDLLAVRRRLRWLVDAVGFSAQDQTRLATGLSGLLTAGLRNGRATIEVGLDRGRDGEGQVLVAVVGQLPAEAFTPVPPGEGGRRERLRAQELTTAVVAVERLVHRVLRSPADQTVRIEQPLPVSAPLSADRVASIVDEVTRVHPGNPFAEIQRQNRELVGALRELQARTLALEDAQRGVSALTAEVGDKALALRDAESAAERLTQTVAHEIRGPLYAVRALLDSMLDPRAPLSPEQLTEDLRQIDLTTAEALRLVDVQLDSARARADVLTPQLESVAVAEILSTVRGMTAPLCRPGVRLSVDGGGTPEALVTDPHLLGQALRNLVGNALKFTDAGQVVLSVAEAPGGTTVFTVADTGIGIPEEALERIFEEFERIESGRAGRLPGTGLGLPLVRTIARSLGGEVSVTSRAGIGTTFRLTLPARPAPAG